MCVFNTATAGSDYIGVSKDVIFPASSIIVCLDIGIIDNLTVEEHETFTVTLTAPNLVIVGTNIGIDIGFQENVATITITDIDSML